MLSPSEILGSWRYAVEVLSIYYKPVDNTDSLNKIVKQSPDFNSSLLFMCKQYKNHLTELNKSCLTLSEFGDKIMQMVLTVGEEIEPEVPMNLELPPIDSYVYDLSVCEALND